MNKILFLLTVVQMLAPVLLPAQKDTIFLDGRFRPTDKKSARYFRFVDFAPRKNQYKITDYFLNGKIQMEGFSDKPDADHMTGKVIHYLESGIVESICKQVSYKTGWVTYYDEDFKKTAKAWEESGKRNGNAVFYDPKGKKYATCTFKNGVPYSGEVPYIEVLTRRNLFNINILEQGEKIGKKRFYKNRKLAAWSTLKDEYIVQKTVFYDRKGKLIGECVYDGAPGGSPRPMHGINIEFSDNGKGFSDEPAEVRHISVYENGSVISRQSFDGNGNQIADCNYENNNPMEGSVLNNNVLKTYKKGINTGWNTEYNKKITRVRLKSRVENGVRQGETLFYDTTGVLAAKGEFKDDKPWSGRVFYEKSLCDFKDGERAGTCFYYNSNEALIYQVPYQDGKKEGEAVFKIMGTTTEIKGIYKNGKPFSGCFPVGSDYQFERFEDGEKVEKVTYFQGTSQLQKTEAFRQGTTREFDKQGKLLLECEIRNGTPFNGYFRKQNGIFSYQNGKKNGICEIQNFGNKKIKTETYLDDVLEGETVWYADTAVVAKCIFKKGQPFEGVFLASPDSSFTYRNGLKSGISKKKFERMTVQQNWVDGKPEGKSEIVWKKHLNGRDTTMRCTGIYQSGQPQDGCFLMEKTLVQFAGGMKNGIATTFVQQPGGSVAKQQTFRNDIPVGEAIYILEKDTVRCNFKAGLPWEGFAPSGKNTQMNADFTYYLNGEKTNITQQIDVRSNTNMVYHNGLPFKGKRFSERGLYTREIYENGRLKFEIQLLPQHFYDTLSITQYSDSGSVRVNTKGQLMEKTLFTVAYATGCTDYYDESGKITSRVCFENNKMISGCYHTITRNSAGAIVGEKMICVNAGAVTIVTEQAKGVISKTQHIPAGYEVKWPVVFDYDFNAQLNNANSTIKYIENSTGREIASCTVTDRRKNGFEIEEADGYFQLYSFRYDSYTDKSFKALTFNQLLEKIEAWKLE